MLEDDTEEQRHAAKRSRRAADATDALITPLPPWLDDELRCVICMNLFVCPASLSGCRHTFCNDCISQWLETPSNLCPVCRHRPQVHVAVALTPNRTAQGLLDHYVLPQLPPSEVNARRKRAREVAAGRATNMAAMAATNMATMAARTRLTNMWNEGIQGLRRMQQLAAASISGAASASGASAPQGLPAAVKWDAVSSNVPAATPCRSCRVDIPPRFLRMQRTRTVTAAQFFYHANYHCLRPVHHEIRAAPTIHGLADLSNQEQRVVNALRAVVTGEGGELV